MPISFLISLLTYLWTRLSISLGLCLLIIEIFVARVSIWGHRTVPYCSSGGDLQRKGTLGPEDPVAQG